MKFTFSLRQAFKDSWQLFARHPLFYGGLALVMVIFDAFSNQHHHNPIAIAIVSIAAIVLGYVWVSVALAATDGKEAVLNYQSLSTHLPSAKQFFIFLLIGILVGLICAVGFILLIIPGIYFLVRLSFATTAYVDRQEGIKKSLEYSWHLVKGKVFWTVLWVFIVEVALMVVGTLALFVGLLITYPLAMLIITRLYRALDQHHRAVATETNQPVQA